MICPRVSEGFDWAEIRAWESELGPDLKGLRLPFLPFKGSAELGAFRGGEIQLCHDERCLYVWAHLLDEDIFNLATRRNERTWESGDVLELFLKRENQEAYYEFHVTPENQTMQVRFDSAAHFRSLQGQPNQRELFAALLIGEPLFESRTCIRPGQSWDVMAALPLLSVMEVGELGRDLIWQVSFCRYDYSRGEDGCLLSPRLSSTSKYLSGNFHEQCFWSRLHFHLGGIAS
ncbi:MAG: hypothetical protein HC904_01770 [Blastochloris sp.]|nr:hypothetical protein [Blastochloris sp.]